MAAEALRWMAAGGLLLAAGCVSGPSLLDEAGPLVQAMEPQVAAALGAESLSSVRLGELQGSAHMPAACIGPNRIYLHPDLQALPRSMLLWAVTHELAHLHHSRPPLPWPMGVMDDLVEEAEVELLSGDLLPGLERAARRVRHPEVRWLVDRVRRARSERGGTGTSERLEGPAG